MPFIDVRTSGTLSAEQETAVKAELGKAISLIPGKTESGLMIQLTDGCHMWFGGEQQGTIAFVNVMLYGSASAESYKKFSDSVIPMLEDKLGADKVYLKFEEVSNWFWN